MPGNIPKGMKQWAGGDSAPADWDGGRILLRDGFWGVPPDTNWRATVYWHSIIAYTPLNTGASVIVERGDTLSHIAERMLGRASAWPMLARINRLRDPHLIVPGQRIYLENSRG